MKAMTVKDLMTVLESMDPQGIVSVSTPTGSYMLVDEYTEDWAGPEFTGKIVQELTEYIGCIRTQPEPDEDYGQPDSWYD